MSFLFSPKVVHYDEFQPKGVKHCYQDIQRDPYKYLLSSSEKATAYASIPRIVFGYGLGCLWVAYHLRRNNQLHRLFKFKLSGDMVVESYWRLLVGFIVGERLATRYYCNYRAIWNHKAADYEVRKIMRTIPDAKPFIKEHDKPNSYLWV